ncbi:hypothetical protein [Spartinivicinus ruber]|uniref:hypothetical protein n=1 Tax=Spartinivicinus ruber TaxID=2683272 RepID=UPI0013D08EAA|nr:hypothetical protein [Spartinivicinus ruber]
MKIKSISNVNETGIEVNGSYQPGLTSNRIYNVLGMDHDSYRILADDGEPYMYPKELFEVIDDNIPSNWVRREFEDGEYYLDPPELSELYFYEDYFDGVPSVVERFRMYLKSNNFLNKDCN